jgi:hypothetical protein
MKKTWMLRGAAVALLWTAACGDDSGPADAGTPIDAAPEVGRIQLAWTLLDDGVEVSCDAVGASTVRISALPDPGFVAEVDALTCSSGSGETRLLAQGRYDVTVDLRAGGATIGTVEVPNVEVVAGETADLGTLEFEVAATGTLTFTLGSDAGSLCAGAAGETLGLEGIVLALRDADGACTPTDFAIGAGATQPAGTYSSDCAVAFACIEGDQQITATGVVGGPRTLQVQGLLGGNACYGTTSNFTMPGNDETEDLGVVSLAHDPGEPGCGDDASVPIDAGASLDAALDGGA